MKDTIIRENNFEKARNKIRQASKTNIIFSSDNDELNRKVMEKEKINTLLINQSKRKTKQNKEIQD